MVSVFGEVLVVDSIISGAIVAQGSKMEKNGGLPYLHDQAVGEARAGRGLATDPEETQAGGTECDVSGRFALLSYHSLLPQLGRRRLAVWAGR